MLNWVRRWPVSSYYRMALFGVPSMPVTAREERGGAALAINLSGNAGLSANDAACEPEGKIHAWRVGLAKRP